MLFSLGEGLNLLLTEETDCCREYPIMIVIILRYNYPKHILTVNDGSHFTNGFPMAGLDLR